MVACDPPMVCRPPLPKVYGRRDIHLGHVRQLQALSEFGINDYQVIIQTRFARVTLQDEQVGMMLFSC